MGAPDDEELGQDQCGVLQEEKRRDEPCCGRRGRVWAYPKEEKVCGWLVGADCDYWCFSGSAASGAHTVQYRGRVEASWSALLEWSAGTVRPVPGSHVCTAVYPTSTVNHQSSQSRAPNLATNTHASEPHLVCVIFDGGALRALHVLQTSRFTSCWSRPI